MEKYARYTFLVKTILDKLDKANKVTILVKEKLEIYLQSLFSSRMDFHYLFSDVDLWHCQLVSEKHTYDININVF